MGSWELPGGREKRVGESDREIVGEVGDVDLTVRAGEAGRASREMAATDGLAALGGPPPRAIVPGRAMPPATRETAGGVATVVEPSWVLGPETRRRRSSSWVLSFGGKGPTNVQTFSPIST